MSVKLIALDLDGTLTNDEKKISEHTRETLHKAAEHGAVVVLASGRPVLGITPLAEVLDLKTIGGYIMAFNGGKILDCRSDEVISTVLFDPEYIPEAVAYSRKTGIPILTYSDTEILSEGPVDRWAHREEINCAKDITLVESLSDFVDFPIVKMMLAGDPEKLKKPEAELAEQFEGRLDIYRAEPHFLELMPKGINKAEGLRILTEHMGITPDEVMACGDANNDIPMLEFAGIGVAVANGSEAVRKAADFVSKSNNEDGVAYAVEKFVLGK